MRMEIYTWATALGLLAMGAGAVGKTTVEIDLEKGKAISPDLVGIFYEDLSYAADRPEWNSLTSWELVKRDGGQGSLVAESTAPLHANTPNYAVLAIDSSSGQAGLTASNEWYKVTGSDATNQMLLDISSSASNVFFRLIYPQLKL